MQFHREDQIYIMIMCLILLSFILISSTGCGDKLRPDEMVAIDHKYPTAEMIACGQRWHGVGVCSIKKGESFDKVGLKIQTYYEGTLRVTSKACGIDISKRYSDSEVVSVNFPEEANSDEIKACLVTVTVSPEYPDEDESGIRVRSFQGHFGIRVVDPLDDWEGAAYKNKVGNALFHSIFVGNAQSASVMLFGCGVNYHSDVKINSNMARLRLSDAISDNIGLCVLEGAIETDVYAPITLSIMVARYSKSFALLPIPEISFKYGKIKVKADGTVSVIALDDDYKIKRKTRFKWDKNKHHVLRTLTVGGRSVIGIWDKKNWRWLQ